MFTDGYQVCGFLGGLMFPIATGIQTVKAVRTGSTEDISYGWQGIYGLAETLYIIYAIHFQLWVLAIPLLIEIFLLITMILIKIYLENCYHTYVDGVKIARLPPPSIATVEVTDPWKTTGCSPRLSLRPSPRPLPYERVKSVEHKIEMEAI